MRNVQESRGRSLSVTWKSRSSVPQDSRGKGDFQVLHGVPGAQDQEMCRIGDIGCKDDETDEGGMSRGLIYWREHGHFRLGTRSQGQSRLEAPFPWTFRAKRWSGKGVRRDER